MKIAKIVGLVAVAALALMASLGANTAFAAETTLCKTATDSPYCQAADRYPSGTTFKASPTSGKTRILTNLVNVSCSESTLEGKTSGKAGDPLPISISAWSLGNCQIYKGASCAVTAVNLPYSGTFTWSSGSKGTLAIGNSGKGAPGWNVECSGPPAINCTFTFEPSASFEGGNLAQLTVAESTMSESGSLCPGGGTFQAPTYTVSSPEPAYLANALTAEAHTRLCKAAESPCAIGNTYPSGTTIEAEASKLEIKTTSYNINCGKSTVSAKTQAIGAEPLPLGNVVFTLNECKSTAFGLCSMKTSELKSPTSWIETSGTYTATVNLHSLWEFNCKSPVNYTCTFGLIETLGAFFNDLETQTLTYNAMKLAGVAGSCPPTSELYATFTVTTPEPLFAT